MKENVYSKKRDAQAEIELLKARINNNSPNILHLLDYSTSFKKKFCSSNYMVRSYYRLPFNDAKQLFL